MNKHENFENQLKKINYLKAISALFIGMVTTLSTSQAFAA
jgi:hypothetical protein